MGKIAEKRQYLRRQMIEVSTLIRPVVHLDQAVVNHSMCIGRKYLSCLNSPFQWT